MLLFISKRTLSKSKLHKPFKHLFGFFAFQRRIGNGSILVCENNVKGRSTISVNGSNFQYSLKIHKQKD